jgi:hypothetical protein
MGLSLGRLAMILSVCRALLTSTAGPALADSKLMPTPSVSLGQGQPTTPAPAEPAGKPLPRTGIELPSQLVVAAVMLVGGLALRIRRPARGG